MAMVERAVPARKLRG